MCSEFSPPLYLPAPEFPLIDGETVSAQIQSEMNLGFMKRKASYKKKKSHRPIEISYHTMDLVLFRFSHYALSYSDSDGWELSSSVWGGFGCVRAITASIHLWSAAVGKELRRIQWSSRYKTEVCFKLKTNKYCKCILICFGKISMKSFAKCFCQDF